MAKLDLHTHSIGSKDGGLTLADYRRAFDAGQLDAIAITDHSTIDFALCAQAELGERLIVGEEIMTSEGELTGLYLQEPIQSGQSALETAKAIRAQGGLVYVPHPFETKRKGLSETALQTIADQIAIVETRNGRAWLQSRTNLAQRWAADYRLPGAASSDAHGPIGWGETYTIIADLPTRDTLVQLLAGAELVARPPALMARLYPTLHRLRRTFTHE